MDFLFQPAPATDVADWLRLKAPLRKDQFAALLPELRALAFTVSGIHAADALQDLRDTVATFPEGQRFDDVKKKVAAKLGQYLESDQLDLVLGDDQEDTAAERKAKLERRAQFLIRHHGNQAYAVAVHRDLEENGDIFPFWKYLTVGDEHVRATHRALNNVVLPKDHEFWRTHFPPWEFGCRCQIVPVTGEEYKRYQEADAAREPWERDTLTDDQLQRLTDERKLLRKLGAGEDVQDFDFHAPIEKSTEPGVYIFNPGEFQIPLNTILDRYDEATQKAFTAWAKGQKLPEGGTVWGWLNQGRKVEGGRRKGTEPPQPAAAKKGAKKAAKKVTAPAVVPPAATKGPAWRAPLDKKLDKIEAALAANEVALAKLRTSRLSGLAMAEAKDALGKEKDALIEQARQALALPKGQQCKIQFTRIDPEVDAVKLAKAQEFIERIVHRDLMPAVMEARWNRRLDGGHYTSPTYGTTWHGMVVGNSLPVKTFVHELGHAIEDMHKPSLQRSVKMLTARRGTEPLKQAPNTIYATDQSFDDEWDSRKGSVYTGIIRYHQGRPLHTEAVSMGLERMFVDPMEFRREDPQHFNFTLALARKRKP